MKTDFPKPFVHVLLLAQTLIATVKVSMFLGSNNFSLLLLLILAMKVKHSLFPPINTIHSSQ